jgi:hypothetical protein
MLTGATPRDFRPGADPVAIVLREPAIPIRQRLPALPAALASVVDDMLNETGTSAPLTAADFDDALAHL